MVKVLIYTYNSSYSATLQFQIIGWMGGGVATDNNKWKKGGGVDKKFKKIISGRGLLFGTGDIGVPKFLKNALNSNLGDRT